MNCVIFKDCDIVYNMSKIKIIFFNELQENDKSLTIIRVTRFNSNHI